MIQIFRISSTILVLTLPRYRPVQGFSTHIPATTSRSHITTLFSEKQPKKFNPLETLMYGLSSTFSSSSSPNKEYDSFITSTITKTWEDIETELEPNIEQKEQSKLNLSKGYGPASPQHKVRLYDSTNKEEDIRVTFYRDSASWCPYCQKVWTMLEEKRIPYRVNKINMRCYGDKPRNFLQIQPSGNIPVAEIDGVVYGQSNDIMAVLEQKFPEAKSTSPLPEEQEQARYLMQLERRLFGVWMYWLTGSFDTARSKTQFLNALDEVEMALSKQQNTKGFFLGDRVTTVDFMFVPFFERMLASLLYYKGFQIRFSNEDDRSKTTYPHIHRWFDAMETLDSYRLTKSDYYTHCWDLPPQLGGCTSEASGAPYQKAINGERTLDKTQGSWEFPLQPHNGGIEPDWDWIDDTTAKRHIIQRLCDNHENIVEFAARGAGKAGFPPVMAPLADPNATPNDSVKASVDTIFRCIALALLHGKTSVEEDMKNIATKIREEGGDGHADNVVQSLTYLRDRVGVPRDLSLPAARLLRANLNWAIGMIL